MNATAALATARYRYSLHAIADDVVPDSYLCDQACAHVDDRHEQEWCGWLTPAEQLAEEGVVELPSDVT